MEAQPFEGTDFPAEEDDRITRVDTGLRVLLTLLFALVWGLIESVLAVIVVFALAWALVTRRAPPLRLRDFSNRLVSYSYRIWRYITYNDARLPFPFSDFPAALEDPAELGPDDAVELRELLDTSGEEDELRQE